jgi:hypothetical protein
MKTRKFDPENHNRANHANQRISFKRKVTPEEKELVAESVLRDYRGLYDDVERAHALISDNPKKRHIVEVWKEAHDWLTKLSPLLHMDHDIPNVEIRIGAPHTVGELEKRLAPVRGMDRMTIQFGARFKATDLITGGILLWLTEWLSSWIPRRGPRGSPSMVQAAYMLAEISKLDTNRTDWNWVREKIEQSFPECGHHRTDWIRDRVKKFKKGHVAKYRQLRKLSPFTFGFDISPSSKQGESNKVKATSKEAVRNATVFFTRLSITPPSAVLRAAARKPQRKLAK